MVLVDSSVWVEALRLKGDLRAKTIIAQLLEDGSVRTCPVVKLEILGAARKDERKLLDSYFRNIISLKISELIWNEAINLSRTLRDKGLAAPWNDIVIASVAIHYSLPLYHVDKHFTDMSKLTKLKILAASQ